MPTFFSSFSYRLTLNSYVKVNFKERNNNNNSNNNNNNNNNNNDDNKIMSFFLVSKWPNFNHMITHGSQVSTITSDSD